MRLAGLAALGLALAALPRVAAAQAIPIALNPGEVLLKVEGEGEHLDRPDVMGVGAAVVTTGRTAKDALAANSALANRLIEAVRASGVEPRDVQTSDLTVKPQFEPLAGGDRGEEEPVRRIVGYVARNELSLRLRDLKRAPAVVDALFEAGANDVRGPSFSLSDPTPAVRAARRAAVAAANGEAQEYAEALGMRVARILRVSERGSFEGEEGDYITVTGSRIPQTPLEPGEIATRMTVWIDYALIPR